MRIYVGNLSYNLSEEELRQEFAAFGEVESVTVVTDRFSGRPRGFGFVEMPSKEEGEAAIASLNGKMLDYRAVVVNEARPRSDSRGGGRSYGDSGGRDSGGGDRPDRD
ncbi:MAG: RNA-binding protein [Dehalococcoidales bacterium]